MKGKRGDQGRKEVEDFVQIDAYMIPAAQAEMYRVLREAVAEDLLMYLEGSYAKVLRVSDDEAEGEAILALDEAGQEMMRIYLNPTNISLAQKARDKGHIDKFVEQFERG